MTKTVEQLREELTAELHRQEKEHHAFQNHKKGSDRRRQAKARLHRLRGLIVVTQNELALAIKRAEKEGPDAAVRWALSKEGITEHPMNSNWGVPVQDWIHRTGYGGPVPWCGCFVHEAVVVHGKAKIPIEIHLGLNTAIIADAQAHRNGLKAVPFAEARRGDIVVYKFPHIGLVRGDSYGPNLPTVEGNTSPSTSGSQFNGGCVARKVRGQYEVAVIARPTGYPG